jgi:ABC-type multidrug transport system ATPase subunit/ABC-type multidrug transport system permease subunit
MDVISLRKTSGVIEGEVRLNGFLQERVSFLRSSGYVEQFDVQQAELTVRETVVFSARLRLSRDNPVTATDRGRLKFVDYVLEMMELTDIAQLQVGSYELGGLTFEQRKRLAIAVELAASPSVVFLDEPTSGLDSRGALVIMRAMKKIADTGRTVCATIHQPSAAVFEMFDDLLLLKRGGEVVFFGELGEESCDLVEYFESRGAKPIEHGENPAAWMLTAYTKDDPHDADGNGSASGNGNGSGAPSKDWKEEFEQSKQYMTMKETIAEIKANPDESKKLSFDKVFAASRYTREVLMMRRTFRIMMRSPSYNLARIMLAIVYSLILGTVFLGTQNKQKVFSENMVDGILSTIFLAMTIIGVVSVSMAVPVMKQIRDVFYKHRASGMLDHQSVSLSAAVGELPFIVIMSAIFCSIYYSLVGLFQAADKWFMFFLWFALNIATYTYFGQAFICMVRDIPTASALVGALIGFNVFFSGLVVRPQYFVGVFQIGFWTAPGRFVYEGVIVSQFIGLEYPVTATPYSPFWFSRGCTDPDATCTGTMEDYVNFFFGGKFSRAHQPIDLGVTFFCLFLARFALFVSLKYLNYVNT